MAPGEGEDPYEENMCGFRKYHNKLYPQKLEQQANDLGCHSKWSIFSNNNETKKPCTHMNILKNTKNTRNTIKLIHGHVIY